MYLEVTEGMLDGHVAPAEAVIQVFFPAVQVPYLGLHEPGEKSVCPVPNDEG